MKWGIYLIIILLAAALASATYISISTTVKTVVQNDTLTITTNVSNLGDESAYNVQFITTANGKTEKSKIFDIVGIKQPVVAEVTFDVKGMNNGKYPIITQIDYADANQYPFSALTNSFYVIGENVNSDVVGQMDKIEISKSGTLSLKLRNLANTAKTLSVKLYLPKELSTSAEGKTISIGAKSQEDVSFNVESFSALKGSTYIVFATIEYDEAGIHYTSFAQSFVAIVEKKGVYGLSTTIIIVILAVLAVAFIVLQFRKKK